MLTSASEVFNWGAVSTLGWEGPISEGGAKGICSTCVVLGSVCVPAELIAPPPEAENEKKWVDQCIN